MSLSAAPTLMGSLLLALVLQTSDAGTSERRALLSIDAKTGAIVLSGGRRESSEETGDGIVIRIVEDSVVSQPPPFTKGRTVVVPRTRIIIDDERGRTWAPLRVGESAESLVEKLNQMGLNRAELIEALEKLRRAGIYRGDVIAE